MWEDRAGAEVRKPLNPDWPVPEVGSVDELMGIAVAMEAEAARRYEQLARRVTDPSQTGLAELFTQLAQLERDHQHGLEAWAGREGRRPPVEAHFGWQLPETFGDDADERPLDPYLALAVAVRNEERAFSFYAYLAAQCASRPQLRDRAEALAREELKHVVLLRGMRRRAFHARAQRPTIARVHNAAALRRLAGGLEAGSADLDALLAAALGDSPAARVLAIRHGDRAAELSAATAATPASPTVELARRRGDLNPGALAAGPLLQLVLADAQEVMDTYLSVADAASDEEVLALAQELAERAMARLALVSQIAASIHH